MFICDRCVDRAIALAAGDELVTGNSDATLTVADSSNSAACGFCGKRADQAAHIVTGEETAICGDCLALCREIRSEEQGGAA